jgi:hypothetical protein
MGTPCGPIPILLSSVASALTPTPPMIIIPFFWGSVRKFKYHPNTF